MKKVKVEYRVGDFVTAEFVKNQKEGKKPIILVEGMVCFVDKSYRGPFLQEHAIWQFEIMQIKEKTMVVMPVQKIKTPKQNLKEIDDRMKDLEKKFAHPKGKTAKTT